MTDKEPLKNKEEKSNKKLRYNIKVDELFQFIIAMIIIISFTVFVYIVLSVQTYDKNKFDSSYQLIAMLAPFLGTIIGFYFGQKPVQHLTGQVGDLTSKNNDINKAYNASGKLNLKNEELIRKQNELVGNFIELPSGVEKKSVADDEQIKKKIGRASCRERV